MKPITIGIARSGLQTAAAEDIRIHSAYDPYREAGRYLDGLKICVSPGATIVVIGAGLGYLDAQLRSRHTSSPIISFHLDAELHRNRMTEGDQSSDIRRWYPGCGTDPERFLFENLEEHSIAGLKIIEWPASFRARPETATEVSEALSSVIRRYSGNLSATAAFGRHWIRNAMRNFIEAGRIARPHMNNSPVILAASGPSLEESLSLLTSCRERFRLWSLPSSLPALLNAGLIPDLIFATDPGHWAKLHGRYFPPGIPVAMPLSAAPLPVQAGPPLLIPHGAPGEARLLDSGAWPVLPLPAMGTVAATAVEAWKRLSGGILVLAGLDLAWTDLRSHARPHAFDGWLSVMSGRLRPTLTVSWERAMAAAPEKSGAMRTGPSMKTYADWFRGNTPEGRVFRFKSGKSTMENAPIPNLRNCDEDIIRNFPKSSTAPGAMEIGSSPLDRPAREAVVSHLISHWRNLIRWKPEDPEARELMYTLDPGGVLEIHRLEGEASKLAGIRHMERVRALIDGLAVHHD